MDMQQAIQTVIDGKDLSHNDMMSVMQTIMSGKATPSQIAGFLIGLRIKGETVDEIAGAAKVMRQMATPVHITADNIVDIVGTGGDGLSTFNISSASTFVVAAAGGHVAKHGNRSVSSSSGAADVLDAAGVNLDITPEQVARCVEDIGVGFMFAVKHHGAMKHAIGPRREMGVRTIFNVLGPLTNPAGAENQLLGVFSQDLLLPMTQVLKQLGSKHVMTVHSKDGLDEISIADETYVTELKNGEITQYTISPEQFGFERGNLKDLMVGNAVESLAMLKSALTGHAGSASDIVALNAGAAIYCAGLADTLAEGIECAQDAMGSGLALEKLNELVAFTSVFRSDIV